MNPRAIPGLCLPKGTGHYIPAQRGIIGVTNLYVFRFDLIDYPSLMAGLFPIPIYWDRTSI